MGGACIFVLADEEKNPRELADLQEKTRKGVRLLRGLG